LCRLDAALGTLTQNGNWLNYLKTKTMRLSPTELGALRSILHSLDPDGQIYLFGSRADDSRRGGDIDVYLQASNPISLKTALTTQYRMSGACNAKVDLLIKNPGEPDQPIHEIAREGVLL
jgi:predicted nucleotidyltransferase